MSRFVELNAGSGALVSGLDLDQPISTDMAQELRRALDRYKLLLFRQGPISGDQQVALMRSFGNVISEAPNGELVSYISSSADAYVRGTNRLRFHSDIQCAPSGPIQTVSLYALEMERDEPTYFADMVKAARDVPPELRSRIAGLDVVQALNLSAQYDESKRVRMSERPDDVPLTQYPHCNQPVLGTHRLTGEEMINVSELSSSHVVGLSDDDSDVIFDALSRYQYSGANIYAHRWQVDDLVVWDNIALQHARNEIAAPTGRCLRRVAVNPIGLAEMLAGATSSPAAGRSAIAGATTV